MSENTQLNLDALFKPHSVAILGISPKSNRATLAYQNLKEIGYRGEIYFVNQKYAEVHGQKCYSSLKEIPHPIEAVYVSIPGEHVLPALKEAAEIGVKGAVVISSGFGEGEKENGKAKWDELVKFSKQYNFAVCGPNCLGIINAANDFASYGFFFPDGLKKGKVGGVFQSGGLMHAITGELGRRGVGISTIVSSGNETIVNSSHYLEYLAADPETEVIMAFVEGIKDPERFLRAADIAQKKRKPIILVKVGKSEKAVRAAIAHTGSLTGSDQVIDAVFREKGIIRVSDVDELIETVLLFSKGKFSSGKGVAITTTSGGEAGMYADLGDELGIEFPGFEQETNEKLIHVLPEFGSIGNPLDTTGNAALNKEIYSECLGALAQDPNVHVIAVSQMDITEKALQHNKATQVIVESVQECAEKYDKPILVFTPNAGGADDKIGKILMDKGIPLLVGARSAFKAIGSLIDFAAGTRAVDNENTHVEKDQLPQFKQGTITERESQEVFSHYGIPVAQKILVESPAEAIQAAKRIGYPVVMKIESPDIPHKSDAGGVKLNLKTDQEVWSAYTEILSSVAKKHPYAKINGIVVEEMVSEGVEVIAGVKTDPTFGPVVMVGSGGVLVELLQDVSLRLAPLTRIQALQMIKETKLIQQLAGFRGKPEADIDSLIDVLLKLSQFAENHQDILQEAEINPLLVLSKGEGCRAVDGLIVWKEEKVEAAVTL